MAEIYVSTDVETDGPIPGPHSLLSLASAAYRADGQLVATFSVNLEELPGAAGHPETLAWWRTQPEAWRKSRESPLPAQEAMGRYGAWVRALPGKPVFVAYPLGFDALWVTWYFYRFLGDTPFGYGGIDIRSFAMALLGREFRGCSKPSLPRSWFAPLPHTHVALDDALEQGALFLHMLAESRARPHDLLVHPRPEGTAEEQPAG